MRNAINGLLIVFVLILFAMGACGAEPSERDVVAMTILGEARGEGEAGMYAVACVIAQRVINRNKTAKQVILSKIKIITQNLSVKPVWPTPLRTNHKILRVDRNTDFWLTSDW